MFANAIFNEAKSSKAGSRANSGAVEPELMLIDAMYIDAKLWALGIGAMVIELKLTLRE